MIKRILIAENDEDIRFILHITLKQAGYEVEPFPDGSSIMNRSRDWPDLFILEKDMPAPDGLAISKYLKCNHETRDIPIIMISAYHKLRSKAREAGVNDFIEKPIGLKSLLQVIEKYV